MIRNITLVLAIAAVSTGAAAQSGGKTDWSNLLKPYEAKTNPPVQIARPAPVTRPQPTVAPATAEPAHQLTRAEIAIIAANYPTAPVAPHQPAAAPIPAPQPAPATSSNPLLDGCVISAIGRLPKADGLRVTKSSYEFLESNFIGSERTELYDVFVSVDLNGRQASYGWRCLVYGNRAATLHPR